MGLLSAVMFFVLSNAKPLEKLSAQRPVPNIFCAYVFLSLLGQFMVHLVYLVVVWNTALASMPPVRAPEPGGSRQNITNLQRASSPIFRS